MDEVFEYISSVFGEEFKSERHNVRGGLNKSPLTAEQKEKIRSLYKEDFDHLDYPE